MTTTRSYRKAMSGAAARQELERCSGSHFDPAVVSALLSLTSPSGAEQPGEQAPHQARAGRGHQDSGELDAGELEMLRSA